jgi:hypothetical protein
MGARVVVSEWSFSDLGPFIDTPKHQLVNSAWIHRRS